MNRFSERFDLPVAIGQVVVMAFQPERSEVQSLDELQTVLISKPNSKFPTTYLKFPGGMLLQGETLEQAALRELREETGVVGSTDPNQLVELCRVKKQRHAPHVGEFDIVFYAAFGCNFGSMNDPGHGDVGDEQEESQLAFFKDVATPSVQWTLVTKPGQTAGLFPFHQELLAQAAKVSL